MQEIKTIGVIGHNGMVGSAVYKYFKEHGFETYGYSLSQQEEKEQTLKADCIFVCVPTPFDWDTNSFNGRIVEAVVNEIPDGATIVIKSTVPIGTTERLQALNPTKKLLFNPEFLSESTAYADFLNPDRQYVGYTKESYGVSLAVLNILPESAFGITLPSKEAELLKYINNLHGFLSVIEANHYYDVCQKEGLDYERVINASHASKWVGAPMGRQYHKIFHKGYRGVGGACFPKDINAWLEYATKNGLDDRLMRTVRDINKDILATQNLTEAEAEKK
jgi:UDPglucose 6-dehydrogenase